MPFDAIGCIGGCIGGALRLGIISADGDTVYGIVKCNREDSGGRAWRCGRLRQRLGMDASDVGAARAGGVNPFQGVKFKPVEPSAAGAKPYLVIDGRAGLGVRVANSEATASASLLAAYAPWFAPSSAGRN